MVRGVAVLWSEWAVVEAAAQEERQGTMAVMFPVGTRVRRRGDWRVGTVIAAGIRTVRVRWDSGVESWEHVLLLEAA